MVQRSTRAACGRAAILALGLLAGATPAPIRAATPAGPAVRAFTLVARPGHLTIRQGQTVPVWTFNGSVPGPELRVTQGDTVQITLINHLPAATTIHWHGVRLPNDEDGVAGVTQDAVLPGHRFTYRFVARDAGTFWYHPHQDSANQVDKGLYGSLIVLPRQQLAQPSIDRTLILDDWPLQEPSGGRTGNAGTGTGSMGGMDMGNAASPAGTPAYLRDYVADPSMGTYRTFTVNGKAYPDTTPVAAPLGALVRLRLVNAGYLTHILHLHGTRYRLVATDGSDIDAPQPTGDLLPIAAGQRMDIEFRVPRGTWSLHDHNGLPGADELRVPIGQGTRPDAADARADRINPPVLDLARYGRPAAASFAQRGRFDRSFRLVLQDARGGMPGMNMETAYTINGAAFMRAAPLVIRTGDRVEISFVNKSNAAHPMHLHGHRMQVLALNGEAVTGSPIYQDSVMVLPNRTTVVAFVADNPGVWMLHCHELHHAASGMDTLLVYRGSPRRAQLGGKAGNNPE